MGELFALATAIAWAFAVIFLKRSGEAVPPFILNLFRVAVSSPLLLLTGFLVGEHHWAAAPWTDYLILAASGLIAIAISDTLFHRSLNLIGAGISAIVDTLYSPFTMLAAFLLIGEQPGVWQLAGMALVVSGILVAAWQHATPTLTRRQLWLGIIYGILAMATLALGIVIAKPVLDRSPVLWATAVRQLSCLVIMLPAALGPRHRPALREAFRPSRHWRWLLPGALLGSYLSAALWIAGMKYTQVGVAAVLNQSSTIMIILLASLFLREPFTRRKGVAAVLAVSGILMVTLA